MYANNVNQTKFNRKLRRRNLFRQERKFTRTGSRVTSAFLSQSSGGSLLHVTKNKLIFFTLEKLHFRPAWLLEVISQAQL